MGRLNHECRNLRLWRMARFFCNLKRTCPFCFVIGNYDAIEIKIELF